MNPRAIVYSVLNRLPSDTVNKIRSVGFESILFYIRFLITGKVPLPKTIGIAPSSICNLKCPLCPTGTGKLRQDAGFMPLALYKKILAQIPTLRRVSLFNWGEPFLNPQMLDIINYSSRKKVFTTLHTNFSFPKDESFFHELVHSGLNRLSISLDGASQKTYSTYRVGGEFDLAFNNIIMLNKAKQKNQTKTPVISWQFIVNRFNENEVKRAREMAEDLGIHFSVIPMDMNERHPDFDLGIDLEELKNKWLPKNKQYIEKRYRDEKPKPHSDLYCDFLFSKPVISTDGNVYPCCMITDEMNAFGNINYEPFDKIWNNEVFTSARNQFKKRDGSLSPVDTICRHCQCGCEAEAPSILRESGYSSRHP